MDQEQLHKAFLTELEALETFRVAYTAQYPQAPLSHDDPDVRRLIEALAFFSARTRMAAQRGLNDSVQRIFRQHFPYLLAPLPALAMLRATPTSQFADASDLPAGSGVVIHDETGPKGEQGDRTFFRTLASMRILPVHLRSVDVVSVASGGFRMLLRLQADSPNNQPLDSLTLHINHLDDLASSVMVMQELRAHTRGARALYGEKIREEDQGQPVDVSFGSPLDIEATPDPYLHPLQRARMRLRFPRSELYLKLAGLHPPRNWRHVTLCLDLDGAWPKKLRLGSDSFELFSVPMINVVRAFAAPLEVDGTRDRYVLNHPDATAGFVPLWAVAAQRPSKEGFVPLPPAVFGSREECFEAWAEGRGVGRRGYASFQIASTYKKPERISVDAFWHQPRLTASDGAGWRVCLQDRYIEGAGWGLSGAIVPSLDSWIDGDRETQLELVSMKTMKELGRDELLLLLGACGAKEDPLYAKLYSAISEVKTTAAPWGQRPGLLTLTYEVAFRNLELSDLPRLALFRDWIADLLSHWCEEAPEVVAVVANLDVRMGSQSQGGSPK
jgi:type VI secretion system protein ImpG